MRWTGKVGLCLVAVFAIGAAVTASASAAEYELAGLPEIGRCVQVAPKMGEYKGKSCVSPAAPGKGRYDWQPGPGPNPKFTAIVEEPVLKTSSATITCSFGEAEGSYTNSKTLTVTSLILSGCQKAGAKTVTESWCQNVGMFRGEVKTNELTGEVGYIEHSGKKAKIGLDLKAKTAKALALFECGGAEESIPMEEIGTGLGTFFEIEGSVIGRVKKFNKMLEEDIVTFTVSGGKQVPEKFEGGVNDTLITLVGLTKTAEPSTLATYAEAESEEPIEIKAR
jgi:hypothetical protein